MVVITGTMTGVVMVTVVTMVMTTVCLRRQVFGFRAYLLIFMFFVMVVITMFMITVWIRRQVLVLRLDL